MPELPTVNNARNSELFALGLIVFDACRKSRVASLRVSDLHQLSIKLGDIASVPADQALEAHDEFVEWLHKLLVVDPPVPEPTPAPTQNLATELTPAPEPVQE